MRRYLPLALVAALLSVSLALAVSDVFPARMPRPTPEQYPTVLTGPGAAWDLTTATVGTGTVSLTPSGGRYVHGTTVSCAATGDVNNRFSGWSGDLSGSTTPQNLVMTAAKSITATFIPQWDIAVTTVGTGTVTSDPAGSPAWTYDDGTAVTLTAAAQTGYEFASWSVDTTVASDSTLAIAAIHADKSYTATFVDRYYGITLDGGDNASASGLLTAHAAATAGAIIISARIPDNGARHVLYAISHGTSTQTWIFVDVDQLENKILAECNVDGVIAWRFSSSFASLGIDANNTWLRIVLSHNGTGPTMYLNGVAVTQTVSANNAAWLKAIITDATNKADTWIIGGIKYDGTINLRVVGKLTQHAIYTSPWTLADAQAYDAAPALNIATQFPTGLANYYQMEPGTGTTITDAVGSADYVFGAAPAAPTWWTTAETTNPPTNN